MLFSSNRRNWREKEKEWKEWKEWKEGKKEIIGINNKIIKEERRVSKSILERQHTTHTHNTTHTDRETERQRQREERTQQKKQNNAQPLHFVNLHDVTMT